MNIAFCINRLALAGFGVTISSLVRNCSESKELKVWFLCVKLSECERLQITRLLKAEKFRGQYFFLDVDPAATFGEFNALHGDWSTYGRLLLADLVDVDQILYLDADLLVELDVLEIDRFNFDGHALAAVAGCKFKHALGSRFYIDKLQLSPELEYFNAGVLLFNLREWRIKNLKERCLELARKFPNELPSHDQTLLNLICAGSFAKLPASFNCEWTPHKRKPPVADRMILHFVGSPKPWDLLGSLVHNGYDAWVKYQDEEWAFSYGKVTLQMLRRTWKIRRSYLRCFRNRMIERQSL